jgi:predicted transcriptional regulator
MVTGLDTSNEKRRKYIGVGGDDVPSLGVLEGDILRLLWDAGEPQSSVQVYEAMHFSRRAEKREMQSPSTIAVTLSRMVEKGLLTVERRPRGGKGYYRPTKTRAQIVAAVMDDVSRRLTGQPLGYILTRLTTNAKKGESDPVLDDVITELKRLEKEDNTYIVRQKDW